MSLAKCLLFGIISGTALFVVILLSAFGYVWLNPEGGDRWDGGYCLSHPAFFIIFGVGFIFGFIWQAMRLGRYSN